MIRIPKRIAEAIRFFCARGGAKIKHTKSDASGGKVSHLESYYPQRFSPRPSGEITAAFLWILCIYYLSEPLLFSSCMPLAVRCATLKTGSGYVLHPDRAAGDNLELNNRIGS